MAKIDLNNIVSGFNLSKINDNFQKIKDVLNGKVLWRDNPEGEPNHMMSDLDMNSKRIYNLPEPVADHEPARKSDVDAIHAVAGSKKVLRVGDVDILEIPDTAVRRNKFVSFDSQGNPSVDTIVSSVPELSNKLGKAIISFNSYLEANLYTSQLAESQLVYIKSDETNNNSSTKYQIINGLLVYEGLISESENTSYQGGNVSEALDFLIQDDFIYVQSIASEDGTPNLQAAIDQWVINPNKTVKIIGVCDVRGTIQVPNKETDNPEKRLTITGGSLQKTNPGVMFTKKDGQQLPDGTPLQTGHITFDNVRFLGPRTTAGTFILDGDNIIRTKFVNCYGDGIQLAYAAGYLQSIYVDTASVFRKWAGWLFDCGYLYDVKFYGTAEAGQSFMRTRDTTADPAANSLTVRGVIEGLSGKVFEVGVCFGVVIDGNYQEGNAGGDYDFSIGTGFHKGLTLIGNGFQPLASQLADPNYFPVKLGKGAENSITLIGNSSTGNLFDVAAGNSSAIVDLGNWCGAGKKKFSSTTTRMFGFADNGAEMRFKYLDGYGVGLHSYYSKVGFENARETVGGESITAGITIGPANPQTSPANYPQKNWVKGSIVWAATPTIAPRQYGAGVVHDALIMGWQCMSSGTPGVWREITVMLPY